MQVKKYLKHLIPLIAGILIAIVVGFVGSSLYNPRIEKVPFECIIGQEDCTEIKSGKKESVEYIEVSQDISKDDFGIFVFFFISTLLNMGYFIFGFFKKNSPKERIRFLIVIALLQIILVSILLVVILL